MAAHTCQVRYALRTSVGHYGQQFEREYVVAIPRDVKINPMNMQLLTRISITDISRPRALSRDRCRTATQLPQPVPSLNVWHPHAP